MVDIWPSYYIYFCYFATLQLRRMLNVTQCPQSSQSGIPSKDPYHPNISSQGICWQRFYTLEYPPRHWTNITFHYIKIWQSQTLISTTLCIDLMWYPYHPNISSQGIGQTQHFIKHWQTQTLMSTTLCIDLLWYQWQSGIRQSVFEAIDIPIDCPEGKWLQFLC
jgi:hypothetical protein